MSFPDDPNLELWLADALDLDEEEHAYLASLDLTRTWRERTASATDSRWGWLALIVVLAGFLTWTVASQELSTLLVTANEVGLSTVVVSSLVGIVLDAGWSLIEISTNPALGFSEPLLALLALALLLWPRITSANLRGARS